jgi:hypothetical protein
MEMPKPTAAHERLHALVGTWRGDETLHPSPWDPKGGKASGFLEARMDLDGMFLLTEYREEREGQVSYRGHGVYGWDPRRVRYTMYWFDSLGTDPGGAALGTWDDDRLVFEMKDETGHARYEYRFDGEDQYAFTISRSQDGKTWTTWMESAWRRA